MDTPPDAPDPETSLRTASQSLSYATRTTSLETKVLSYATPARQDREKLLAGAIRTMFRFAGAVFVVGTLASMIYFAVFDHFPSDDRISVASILISWLFLATYCLIAGSFACWIRVLVSKSELVAGRVWPFSACFILTVSLANWVVASFDETSTLTAVGVYSYLAWFMLAPVVIGLFLLRRQHAMPAG
jgi:hypothetical protein